MNSVVHRPHYTPPVQLRVGKLQVVLVALLAPFDQSVQLQEIRQGIVPFAPQELRYRPQPQQHLHPFHLGLGLFYPVLLLEFPPPAVHEILQTSEQLLSHAPAVLPKESNYSQLGSTQTTNHCSHSLVPLQVQEVLQVVTTLASRLLPTLLDSGPLFRPLQLGPPRLALGLYFPQHLSAP